MRMLFWPNRIGIWPSKHAMPGRSGMVMGATSTLQGVLDEASITSRNVGNMVHVEAPAKTFAIDRAASCFGSLNVAGEGRGNPAADATAINVSFDAVCLSFANIIRDKATTGEEVTEQQEATWARLADRLERLNIPVYAFGIGLQEEIPAEQGAITPALYRMLKVLNDRALIFGVRGETTMNWLHRLGLTNARALGCPSMYVYPRNMLAIRSPDLSSTTTIGTAGRLMAGARAAPRVRPLKQLGDAFRTDYVFQNDIWPLARGALDRPVYDEGTGLIDGDFMREVTAKRLGFASPFVGHYLFRDTSRWRMFAHMRDAFIGDRFHGGIVFLQAGRPALILQADARVKELTGFVGIPTLPVTDLAEGDVVETVARAFSAEAIARFHSTYRQRLADYVAVCEGAGLRFADRETISAALGAQAQPG